MSAACLALIAVAWIPAASAGDGPALEEAVDETAAVAPGSPDEDRDARLRALGNQVDVLLDSGGEEIAPERAGPRVRPRLFGYAAAGLEAWPTEGEVGPALADPAFGVEAALGRRARVTAQVVVPLTGTPRAAELVDRLVLEAKLTDGLSLNLGKLYSPFGYYNATWPYGSAEAPSYARPAVLAFERDGGPIATRQVGLDLTGRHLLGSWQLGYHLGAGNGRSPDLRRSATVTDTGLAKAGWGQVSVVAPVGLLVGATAAYDPIRADARLDGDAILGVDTEEVLVVASVGWLRPRTRIIAEAFLVAHSTDHFDSHQYNRSGYLEASHRVGLTTPYLRLDYLEMWAEDPLYSILSDARSEASVTVGARRDLSPKLALKAELIASEGVSYATAPSVAWRRLGGGAWLTAAF